MALSQKYLGKHPVPLSIDMEMLINSLLDFIFEQVEHHLLDNSDLRIN